MKMKNLRIPELVPLSHGRRIVVITLRVMERPGPRDGTSGSA